MGDQRIDELRRRLEANPDARLFAQLAEEYRRAGDHVEAVRVARTGLALNPGYPAARVALGRALLEGGDAAAARSELEEAVRQAPSNIAANRFLGEAQEALGDCRGALAQYGLALGMAPGDVALQQRMHSLEQKLRQGEGRLRQTVREGAAVAVAVPAAPGAAGGDVGERGGREASKQHDSPPFVSSTLAELYFRQGFGDRAIEVYRRIVEMEPGNERARARLSAIERDMDARAAPEGGSDMAARRRDLERAIGGLETLLRAMRRR